MLHKKGAIYPVHPNPIAAHGTDNGGTHDWYHNNDDRHHRADAHRTGTISHGMPRLTTTEEANTTRNQHGSTETIYGRSDGPAAFHYKKLTIKTIFHTISTKTLTSTYCYDRNCGHKRSGNNCTDGGGRNIWQSGRHRFHLCGLDN